MEREKLPLFLQQLYDIGIVAHNQGSPVYKYTSVSTAIEVLTNRNVRFRTPSTFNDPLEFYQECLDYKISQEEFEVKLHKDLAMRAEFSDYKKRKAFIESKSIADYVEAYRKVIAASRNKHLVFCTASHYNKPLMWSHYANNHQGICFGLIMPHMDEGLKAISLKVNYQCKIEPKRILLTDEKEKSIALYYWMFTKSKDWEYEDEVRTVIPLDYLPISLNGRDYMDIGLMEDQLCEIYYGVNTKQEDIDKIEAVIIEKGYKIDRFKMRNVPGTFSFERVPYNHH